MKKEKIFCKLCNSQTNLTIDLFSRYHLKPIHNIGMKEYYDKCIKKNTEGKCLVCGKETKFKNYYKGYQTYCCLLHAQKSEIVRNKISKSFERRDKKAENKKRRNTNLKKYGVEFVTQVPEIRKKQIQTIKERYGVDHNFLMDSCITARWKSINNNKEKINEKRRTFWKNLTSDELEVINNNRIKTNLERYGVEYNIQNKEIVDKMRKTHEKNGNWSSEKEKTEYQIYRHLVRLETMKHVLKVYKKWDGFDYYTGKKIYSREEYINDKNKNHKMQPSIDHKISIYYGFKNNIDPKEIGKFENLCICSRAINSNKSRLTEKEFRKKLNENKKIK